MKIEAKTIDGYFAATGEREPILRELDKLIRESAPSLERVLFNGMTGSGIGYGMFHYKYASGREGDCPIIGLSNQKNYVSLYICAVKDGKYIAEIYKDRLGKVSVGKSCIRFKKLEDLNLDTIKTICKETAVLHKSGNKSFGL